jgi:hypothetical protein
MEPYENSIALPNPKPRLRNEPRHPWRLPQSQLQNGSVPTHSLGQPALDFIKRRQLAIYNPVRPRINLNAGRLRRRNIKQQPSRRSQLLNTMAD